MPSLRPTIFLVGLALLSAIGSAQAQPGNDDMQIQFGLDNRAAFDEMDYALDEQAQAASMAREAQAEANFDAIMIPQNKQAAPAASPPPKQFFNKRRARQVVPEPSDGFEGIADLPRSAVPVEEPEVELPLPAYEKLREQVQDLRRVAERQMGPAVVLGAATYDGEAISGALKLKLELQVTLGRKDKWKTVPLVGDDVVLVQASVDGQPVPVSRRNGYHVWVTQRTGEWTVSVDLLVPSRGPRGSIEYDFLVARTPVTSFRCRFPVAGLEPRINAAVRAEYKSLAGGTLVEATLKPTARIHLLGLKDMGASDGQAAKVYAESLNLLSVDEGVLELFSVIRYTILYAGAKEFDILLPKGMTIVSADGMGAFRFVIEERPNGTLLKGETAFPIRNNYEISLRLKRELGKKGEAFSAPLPRCQGVERESGWLGVEVPGKLQLADKDRQAVTAVDVRQLPDEMVTSAVSPILKAYRYHRPEAQVTLLATRLPEIEPKSASIDRVRAFTKVTAEGDVITDMRITLRNRLEPTLGMTLPEGASLSSAMLDGQPFNPSKDAAGHILLPLKRSSGGDRLRPFTVSVIVESQLDAFAWFGLPELELPRVDQPVSSLSWTVYLPARNIYTALEGEIESQRYVGRASWYQPAYAPTAGGGMLGEALPARGPEATADAGAMPVRFKIPKDGLELNYSRYWIEPNAEVEVEFGYLRSWLRIPAWLSLSLLAALGLLLFAGLFRSKPRRILAWLGLGLFVAASGLGWRIQGVEAAFLGFVGGLLAIAIRRHWMRRIPAAIVDWARTLGNRFSARDRDPDRWRGRQLLWRIVATVGLCFFSLLLAEALFLTLQMLFNPLL